MYVNRSYVEHRSEADKKRTEWSDASHTSALNLISLPICNHSEVIWG